MMYNEIDLFTESHGFQECLPATRNIVYTCARFFSYDVSTNIIVRRIRKIAKNRHFRFAMSLCLSARPYGTSRLSLYGFP
jgi:hypothetical protein